jgi:diguanylate cyclase (GGDEF)-like protein
MCSGVHREVTQSGPEPADAQEVDLLRRVLTPGALTSHKQPVVRLRDGEVIGWEALARTAAAPHVPPLAWLAAGDAAGCRLEVELACLSAAVEDGPAPGQARLFLNTSPALLLDPRFEALLPDLPPHVLEVTENEPVHDYRPLRERLSSWQRDGTLVAIDDVGAGYATMAHVVRLAPAFIKIDRALITGIHQEPEQRAIVSALSAFAAQVGATCIAEGVEVSEELEVLHDIGIDLAQGYLLARPGAGWPLPADAVRNDGPVPLTAGPSASFTRMRAALLDATNPAAAADAVCRYLFEHRRLLPSVYLMRAGRLRCLARRGQWQVLDGLPPGAGITGEAFACGHEVLATDALAHPSYRPAIPGVQAEIALPLTVRGQVVGVLNCDSVAPLRPRDVDAIRSCAQLLMERLDQIGTGLHTTTSLQELSRVARRTTAETEVSPVAEQAVASAIRLSGLDTAVMLLLDEGVPHLAAVAGTQADLLASLPLGVVHALLDLVGGIASVHTIGGSLGVAFGPVGHLRERGVRSVLVVPVRASGHDRGVLLVTGSRAATVAPEAVEAVELLGLWVGSSLATQDALSRMESLVFRDPLTGIANRARFEQVAGKHAERELDPGDASAPLWLALLDIDRFKQVNDRFGHGTGDAVLRGFAQALSGAVRADDLVCRIGGDEFVVLMTAPDEAAAHAALQRLVTRTSDVLHPVGAGVSAGLALLRAGEHTDQAMHRADAELYECKRRGGLLLL